ncbi:hypothetical protein SAY86_015211 [Trapa natans]|uniref:Uncharacterized protein n=1 Tax=Trapa natans TaxID=22666 RepID=A0AAN7QGP3_TRANT|nr:hypothetical protein SAY86_015211 [Trapa natans]
MNPKAPEVIKPAMENAISLLSWIQDRAKDDEQRGCDHQANQRSGEGEACEEYGPNGEEGSHRPPMGLGGTGRYPEAPSVSMGQRLVHELMKERVFISLSTLSRGGRMVESASGHVRDGEEPITMIWRTCKVMHEKCLPSHFCSGLG